MTAAVVANGWWAANADRVQQAVRTALEDRFLELFSEPRPVGNGESAVLIGGWLPDPNERGGTSSWHLEVEPLREFRAAFTVDGSSLPTDDAAIEQASLDALRQQILDVRQAVRGYVVGRLACSNLRTGSRDGALRAIAEQVARAPGCKPCIAANDPTLRKTLADDPRTESVKFVHVSDLRRTAVLVLGRGDRPEIVVPQLSPVVAVGTADGLSGWVRARLAVQAGGSRSVSLRW
jgi:hypothetical protein